MCASLRRPRVLVVDDEAMLADLLSQALRHEGWETVAAPVRGDESALRQILTNLLANARVHTPTGTRVFDRFVRSDSSRTRDGHGSCGLGMSIVESLARAMGGSARLVDSERGTVIDVMLPAA